METTRRNLPWHERLNVQKGDYGEELVKKIVEKCGFNCYRSVTDGAHLVDFLWLNGKKFAFAAEVKTKPKFKDYPATGFDYRHYEQYKQFTADTGIPVFIFFVDDGLKKIYGNFLHVLDEPRKFCGMKYPGTFKKNGITIRYYPMNAMVKIADLSDADAKILKERSESK